MAEAVAFVHQIPAARLLLDREAGEDILLASPVVSVYFRVVAVVKKAKISESSLASCPHEPLVLPPRRRTGWKADQ